MYNEFMNCNSYMFNMQERSGSESISSDGELNDFKHYDLVQQDAQMFIEKEYMRLIEEQYGSIPDKAQEMYMSGRWKDDNLWDQARKNIHKKYDGNKYFNKRILTNERQQVAPRWASDMSNLQKVSEVQQQTMNPDAIFGFIDPNDTKLVALNKMFRMTTMR